MTQDALLQKLDDMQREIEKTGVRAEYSGAVLGVAIMLALGR